MIESPACTQRQGTMALLDVTFFGRYGEDVPERAAPATPSAWARGRQALCQSSSPGPMPSALSWSPAKHTKVRCWLQGVLRTILLRRLSAGLQAVEETKADDNDSDLGGGNELKDASLRTGLPVASFRVPWLGEPVFLRDDKGSVDDLEGAPLR